MYGYIYKTVNLVNGKIYIGQKKSSTYLGVDYLGSGVRLKRAVRKYGKTNFSTSLIEECSDKSQMDEREKYYISYFDSTNPDIGYNISEGGTGGDIISQLSLERQQEIQQKRDETRRNWSPEFLAERNRKLSIASRSREYKLTAEDKARISEALRKSRLGRIYVFKDNCQKSVLPEELAEYDAKGWHRGCLYTAGTVWVHNGEECRHVQPVEVEEYLQHGWTLGSGLSTNNGRIWITNGEESLLLPPDEAELYLSRGYRKGRPRSFSAGYRWVHKDGDCLFVRGDCVEEYLQNGYSFGRK